MTIVTLDAASTLQQQHLNTSQLCTVVDDDPTAATHTMIGSSSASAGGGAAESQAAAASVKYETFGDADGRALVLVQNAGPYLKALQVES